MTDAISFLATSAGFFVINYIDDFGGADTPSRAESAFEFLQFLLRDLGVDEAKKKAVGPTTIMTFLGIQIDTEAMTVSVPQEKLLEVIDVLEDWLGKQKASKQEVQSIIGKLQFVTKCVRPGRLLFQEC